MENRNCQKGCGAGIGGVILNFPGQYKDVVVQPNPAGKSSDVLEAFLSEARSKRSAENIKTFRCIIL